MKLCKTLREGEEVETLRELRKRFVGVFLDLIILDRLESVPFGNGYVLIEYIYRKFHILLSSGTIYSTLYAMEREGKVKGEWKGRKRTYYITPEGRRVLQTVRKKAHVITPLFSYLMPNDENKKADYLHLRRQLHS